MSFVATAPLLDDWQQDSGAGEAVAEKVDVQELTVIEVVEESWHIASISALVHLDHKFFVESATVAAAQVNYRAWCHHLKIFYLYLSW